MKITGLLLVAGCCGLNGVALGDVLELKNGTVLSGSYAGGTESAIRFTTAAGERVIETSEIIALTFTTANPASPAPPPTAPPAAQAPAAPSAPPVATAPPVVIQKPQTVTIPAGTTLLVRMMDSISSKNQAGARFTTKLEYDLSAGNAVAVKGGTLIYGNVQSSTQAGRAIGRSSLDLRLTQIVVNGQPVPITTSGYQQAGKASIGKAAKGAAAGAGIGAIAGNAGKGAAIGAVGGALIRGDTVTVPPGTLLEFTLQQPVTLQAAL